MAPISFGVPRACDVSINGPLSEGAPPKISAFSNSLLTGVVGIGGPTDSLASDAIVVIAPEDQQSYELQFISDPSGDLAASTSISCDEIPGGCQITEDGTVQTAGTVTWSDGTVDTIKFQSDVDPVVVPEPSSMLLLLTGFVALGISKHRGSV